MPEGQQNVKNEPKQQVEEASQHRTPLTEPLEQQVVPESQHIRLLAEAPVQQVCPVVQQAKPDAIPVKQQVVPVAQQMGTALRLEPPQQVVPVAQQAVEKVVVQQVSVDGQQVPLNWSPQQVCAGRQEMPPHKAWPNA
jgi:hypothetical protein